MSSGEGSGWFQAPSSSTKSPRKRLRSPPASTRMPSNHTNTNGNCKSRRQTGPGEKGDEKEDENELDDLDLLGTAALVQFELTQHASNSQSHSLDGAAERVSSVSTVPVLRSVSLTGGTDQRGVTSRDLGRILSSSGSAEVAVHTSDKKPTLAYSTLPTSSVNELEDRVRQLQERNFASDGEVKVLRSANDKYLAELRRKDEQLTQLQAQFSTERRQMEQRTLKEKEELLTRLQFKDQDVRSLLEKNTELELRQRQFESPASSSSLSHHAPSKSLPVKTSSRSSGKKHREGSGRGSCTPSPSRLADFLSTEALASLSQLRACPAGSVGFSSVPASSLRQRVVGSSSGSPHLSRRDSGDSCKTTGWKNVRGSESKKFGGCEGGRSRSISPSPCDTKKMKRKSKSDKDSYTGKSEELDGLYGMESGLVSPKAEASSSQSTVSSSSLASGSSSSVQKMRPDDSAMLPVVVPSRELDGSQLLLLLSRHELLKPPVRVPCASNAHLHQPLSCKQIQGSVRRTFTNSPTFRFPRTFSREGSGSGSGSTMTGLLSLLSLESTKVLHSSSPSSFHVISFSTPLRPSQHVTFPFTPGSTSSIHPVSAATPPTRTPSRKLRLLPSKPHTLARTNPTQTRVGRYQSSNLLQSMKMKSASAATTPEKPRPLGRSHACQSPRNLAISHSLLSSINMDSLRSSIANLWTSSEALRFSSLSSLIGSREAAKQKGRVSKTLQLLEILRQIGNFIVRYHEEQQQLKVLQSSLHSSSCGDGSYDSFDASFIAGTRSPNVRTIYSGSECSSSSSLVGVASSPLSNSQQILGEALSTLKTLAAYSKTVREQILAEPPEFALDSQSLSSGSGRRQQSGVGDGLSASEDDSMMEIEGERSKRGVTGDPAGTPMLAKVSHKLLSLQDSGSEQEVPNSVQVGAVCVVSSNPFFFFFFL